MYQVLVINAIQITGARCKGSGFYQHLQHHHSRAAPAEEIATAEYDRMNKEKPAAALGPGRLSKEALSIEFCKQMTKRIVHILLSLPNATASIAEMDQLFKRFKPACTKSVLHVMH